MFVIPRRLSSVSLFLQLLDLERTSLRRQRISPCRLRTSRSYSRTRFPGRCKPKPCPGSARDGLSSLLPYRWAWPPQRVGKDKGVLSPHSHPSRTNLRLEGWRSSRCWFESERWMSGSSPINNAPLGRTRGAACRSEASLRADSIGSRPSCAVVVPHWPPAKLRCVDCGSRVTATETSPSSADAPLPPPAVSAGLQTVQAWYTVFRGDNRPTLFLALPRTPSWSVATIWGRSAAAELGWRPSPGP